MTVWSGVEAITAREMASWLARTLPRHGGPGYWTAYVLRPLENSAKPNPAEGIDEGDFHAFDLHALLKIVRGCGAELVLHGLLPAGAGKRTKAAIEVRNRNAHAPACGVSANVLRNDVRLIRRLLEDIGAETIPLPSWTASPRGSNRVHPARQVCRQAEARRSNQARILFPSCAQRLKTSRSRAPMSAWISGRPRRWSVPCAWTRSGASSPSRSTLTNRKSMAVAFGTRLVNTVVASLPERLLFGRDAHRLRARLTEGRRVFSSFKMQLGTAIGPLYPQTDSAAWRSRNARGDGAGRGVGLLQALATDDRLGPRTARASAGILSCRDGPGLLRGEPETRPARCVSARLGWSPTSASSMSRTPRSSAHMHASASLGEGLGQDLSRRPMRLCVYDIGAGTCDVSILEVSLLDGRPLSKNLAISRFTALGGDDFDRAIARQP